MFALLLGAKPSTTKAVRTWHQEPASSHGSGIDRGLDHGTWGRSQRCEDVAKAYT